MAIPGRGERWRYQAKDDDSYLATAPKPWCSANRSVLPGVGGFKRSHHNSPRSPPTVPLLLSSKNQIYFRPGVGGFAQTASSLCLGFTLSRIRCAMAARSTPLRGAFLEECEATVSLLRKRESGRNPGSERALRELHRGLVKPAQFKLRPSKPKAAVCTQAI